MRKKRIVVGVVGKYCSGKNTLADILSSYGYREIDVDKIGHEVLEASRDRIVEVFGRVVEAPGGGIDRKKLGAIVFAEREKLKLLEGILHPKMRERIRGIINNSEGNIVINAALLYRMRLHEMCNVIICVKSPIYRLVLRGMKRDGLSLMGVVRRLWSQWGICFKPRGCRVDTYSVWNIGSIEQFRSRALKLLRKYGLIEGNT